jgi:hypothetical protein
VTESHNTRGVLTLVAMDIAKSRREVLSPGPPFCVT